MIHACHRNSENNSREPTTTTEVRADTPVLYRAINPFSVGSVVIGLLSPVAYFHWGSLFVPLLGIALGVAGLVNLSRVEGAKLGVWLFWRHRALPGARSLFTVFPSRLLP